MTLEDRYFEWLTEKVEHNNLVKNHYYLLDTMFSTNYIWSVPNDDNRSMDGEKLRERYGWDGHFSGCSVLEMLIALAERCEHEIMGEPGDTDRTYKWFWEMVDNLGLIYFDDDHFDSDQVDYILNDWLYRRYRKDGNGGLFPLKHPGKDQRKVETWFQMCAYLDENYEI